MPLMIDKPRIAMLRLLPASISFILERPTPPTIERLTPSILPMIGDGSVTKIEANLVKKPKKTNITPAIIIMLRLATYK